MMLHQHEGRRALAKRAEDRDRAQAWTLCPRPICDKGTVWDTVDGIRKPPGYTCSVCDGLGFVPAYNARQA
jgi:hypothetical protein